VACLVWWREALVLEVHKPQKWRVDEEGEVHIDLGGIGGKVEEGETALQALQREALEEIGCPLALQDAPVTYAVGPDCTVRETAWHEPGVRPALVWEACLPGLTPGKCVAVFRGRAVGEPAPGDLPALLCVTPELLLAIGAGGLRLEEAQSRDARLRARIFIPAAARLALTGTPAVLYLLHTRKEPLVETLLKAV
jgi:ADP-ribose pyrophosphatase YjhB (NUDIX family)